MCTNVFVAGDLRDNRSAIIANLKGKIKTLRSEMIDLQHVNDMNRHKRLNLQESQHVFRSSVQTLSEKVTPGKK